MNVYPSDELLLQYAPLKPIPQYPELRAHIADDVFALWEAWEKETGGVRDIPFWAVVWPAAASLAGYLLKNKDIVAGKSVLDFGCGGGIAGIAAAKAGAEKVIGNDIDPVALYVAKKNMIANNTEILLDGKDLLEEKKTVEKFDIILIADMFYEKAKSKILMEFIYEMLQNGAEIIIADGERAYAPKARVQVLHEEVVSVNEPLEGVKERLVRILSVLK
jgi:predicted nicotinamide N-methyase